MHDCRACLGMPKGQMDLAQLTLAILKWPISLGWHWNTQIMLKCLSMTLQCVCKLAYLLTNLFRVCEAQSECVASGFVFLISAWTPSTFLNIFKPFLKPWPLQSAVSMWCSSNVFSIHWFFMASLETLTYIPLIICPMDIISQQNYILLLIGHIRSSITY